MSSKHTERAVAVIAIITGVVAALGLHGNAAGPPGEPARPATVASGAVASATAADRGPLENVTQTFPLRISDDRRYLVDASGLPFLIHGDAAWSLIAQLDRSDARMYLRQRRKYKFNAVLVNLLEKKFATRAPENIFGEPPFETPGDFTTPNDAYFDHVDWVVKRAEQNGILVLLVPAYLGFDGGDAGWYQDLVATRRQDLRRFGRYLGKRYRSYDNILWVAGGDYDPPREKTVKRIMMGISDRDPDALMTMHCGPGVPAMLCLDDTSWLDVNNVYAYRALADRSRDEYRRRPRKPFFLIESTYENEQGVDTRHLRTHAYHAVLSGAAGQVFGNNPIWHFDGPGIYPTSATWQEALTGDGSTSMMHLRTILVKAKWWKLREKDGFLKPVGGGEDNEVVAARGRNRKTALVYVPDGQTITLDLAMMRYKSVGVRWFDPADGTFHAIQGSRFPRRNEQTFVPPGTNSGGDRDWVLFLKSSKRKPGGAPESPGRGVTGMSE